MAPLPALVQGVGAGLVAGVACGAAGGAVGSVVEQSIEGKGIDWGDVGASAVIGGASGGLAHGLHLETITSGEIRSWSNLRNSSTWLPGRIFSSDVRSGWADTLLDTTGKVSYNWTRYLLSC